jgi:predicted Zn finger-like uncharacterized protein
MSSTAVERTFSLTCPHCNLAGIPVRVESQTLATLAMAVRCALCNQEWIAQGAPPAFMLRVKPDRRRPTVGLAPDDSCPSGKRQQIVNASAYRR